MTADVWIRLEHAAYASSRVAEVRVWLGDASDRELPDSDWVRIEGIPIEVATIPERRPMEADDDG